MEQAPVQIGQFILGKNLGIGAFGKVRGRHLWSCILRDVDNPRDVTAYQGAMSFLRPLVFGSPISPCNFSPCGLVAL
jgi:hypothetical protein